MAVCRAAVWAEWAEWICKQGEHGQTRARTSPGAHPTEFDGAAQLALWITAGFLLLALLRWRRRPLWQREA
jgi:hypothetical protein